MHVETKIEARGLTPGLVNKVFEAIEANRNWIPISQFDMDLGDSMVMTGAGYDPYNHVGSYVVAEVIGVEL
jgi:hypothetical protein